MHELGIALSIVEQACVAATDAKATRIESVEVSVGVLSGVAVEALMNCWELACQNTIARGSTLQCSTVPASIYCPNCEQIVNVAEYWRLCCPQCGQYSSDLRTGRELVLISLECS